MARKHSNIVIMWWAAAVLSFAGCAVLKDAASSLKSEPVSTQPINTTPNSGQTAAEPKDPETEKISVKVRSDADAQTLQFDGPYVTLGDVLAKAKLQSDPAKTVAVHRHTNVIYMPSYFATSTDAAKIAIEDDDEVEFMASASSPLETDRLIKFRTSLKTSFPSLFPANVTPSVELLKVSLDAWKEELQKQDFTNLSKDQLESNIAKANQMMKGFQKELSQEGLIGKYTISGIVQNPGVRQLPDVKTIDEILTNELAIVNNVPANIIVLQRGNTFTVLPFRDALRTGTVPANVMSAAIQMWTKSEVLNGDTYQFNRLALFAPVLDGLKKETERKTSKRLSSVAKDAAKNAESYYKEIEKQSRRKEPGLLQKALRSLPNQLPDLKIPGIRLPGF